MLAQQEEVSVVPERRRRPPCRKFIPGEDVRLRAAVSSCGECWEAVAVIMGNRTPRQCRERWSCYLNPDLLHDPFTREELALLFQKVEELGRCWRALVRHFPRRSENSLKNAYYCALRHAQNPKMQTRERSPCLHLLELRIPPFQASAPPPPTVPQTADGTSLAHLLGKRVDGVGGSTSPPYDPPPTDGVEPAEYDAGSLFPLGGDLFSPDFF